jgi:hypothetical protein
MGFFPGCLISCLRDTMRKSNHSQPSLRSTRTAKFAIPKNPNNSCLAMVKRLRDNRQHKVYLGYHRRDNRMMMGSSNKPNHLSSIHNKVSPVKTCSNFWDEFKPEYKPKAARTSEHPTLTVLRTLSASARPGLTSCRILPNRVNDCFQIRRSHIP